MKFLSLRELRNQTAALRKDLLEEKEIVLTANGKPIAILSPVEPETVEETLVAIRRARARTALERIRRKARASGRSEMSMAEIDETIAEVRRQRRSRSGKSR